MKNFIKYNFKSKLIKDLGMDFLTEKSKKKQRLGLFECNICKKEIIRTFQSAIIYTNCKSCATSIRNTKHNLCCDKNYSRWVNMKNRCLRESDKNYKYYGGKGIMIYESWINDFKLYYDYIINLENANKENYTIDRIDCNKNYEPGNLRWSTPSEQNFNKGIQSNNSTGIKCIHFDKRNGGRYIPRVTISKRKRIELGRFKTIEDAKIKLEQYLKL